MTHATIKIAGQIIRTALEAKGISQKTLADMVHVTPAAVNNWCVGKNAMEPDICENVERILNVELKGYYKRTEKTMKLKDLDTIDNMEELEEQIDKIINNLELDEFACTIRYMLKLAMFQMVGFELYILQKSKEEVATTHMLDDIGPQWYIIGGNLTAYIDLQEEWPIPAKCKYPFRSSSTMAKRVEYISYSIGEELFEDVETSGFRKHVGIRAHSCGYELLNLIPDQDNSLITAFKAALVRLGDMLLS